MELHSIWWLWCSIGCSWTNQHGNGSLSRSNSTKNITKAGVSIKFEVGSWSEENNRLYEQGAVRPLNLVGSGGMPPQKILKSGSSKMPFPAFEATNYHVSTSGNYHVCMAIRCEINVKKQHS